MRKLLFTLLACLVSISVNAALYVVGQDFGGGNASTAVELQLGDDGYYTYSTAEWSKISTQRGGWDDVFNPNCLVASGSVVTAQSHTYNLVKGNANMPLPYDGATFTYKISSDLKTVQVTGSVPPASQFAEIYVRGAMNGWGASSDWKMETQDGVIYVLKNKSVTSGQAFKFGTGNWSKGYGLSTTVQLNTVYTANNDPSNNDITIGFTASNVTFSLNANTNQFMISDNGQTVAGAQADPYANWWVNVGGEFNGDDYFNNGQQPVNKIAKFDNLAIGNKGFKVKTWDDVDNKYYISDGNPIPTGEWVQLYYDDVDGAEITVARATADCVYSLQFDVENNKVFLTLTSGTEAPEGPQYPEFLYLLANINGQADWSVPGTEFNNEGDGFYTLEDVVIASADAVNGYFAFTTNGTSDWDAINANRFGPQADKTRLNPTTGGGEVEATFYAGKTDTSWEVPAGTYNITVSFEDEMVVLEKTADFTPELYLIANFNDPEWEPSEAYKFTTTNGNFYQLEGVNIPANAEFKVATADWSLAYGYNNPVEANDLVVLSPEGDNITVTGAFNNATVNFYLNSKDFEIIVQKEIAPEGYVYIGISEDGDFPMAGDTEYPLGIYDDGRYYKGTVTLPAGAYFNIWYPSSASAMDMKGFQQGYYPLVPFNGAEGYLFNLDFSSTVTEINTPRVGLGLEGGWKLNTTIPVELEITIDREGTGDGATFKCLTPIPAESNVLTFNFTGVENAYSHVTLGYDEEDPYTLTGDTYTISDFDQGMYMILPDEGYQVTVTCTTEGAKGPEQAGGNQPDYVIMPNDHGGTAVMVYNNNIDLTFDVNVAAETYSVNFNVVGGEGVDNAYELVTMFNLTTMEEVNVTEAPFDVEYSGLMGGVSIGVEDGYTFEVTTKFGGEGTDWKFEGTNADSDVLTQGTLTLTPGANKYAFTITVNKAEAPAPNLIEAELLTSPKNDAIVASAGNAYFWWEGITLVMPDPTANVKNRLDPSLVEFYYNGQKIANFGSTGNGSIYMANLEGADESTGEALPMGSKIVVEMPDMVNMGFWKGKFEIKIAEGAVTSTGGEINGPLSLSFTIAESRQATMDPEDGYKFEGSDVVINATFMNPDTEEVYVPESFNDDVETLPFYVATLDTGDNTGQISIVNYITKTANGITIDLTEANLAPGKYVVDVPEGYVVFTDGSVNAEIMYEFFVAYPELPLWTSNPAADAQIGWPVMAIDIEWGGNELELIDPESPNIQVYLDDSLENRVINAVINEKGGETDNNTPGSDNSDSEGVSTTYVLTINIDADFFDFGTYTVIVPDNTVRVLVDGVKVPNQLVKFQYVSAQENIVNIYEDSGYTIGVEPATVSGALEPTVVDELNEVTLTFDKYFEVTSVAAEDLYLEISLAESSEIAAVAESGRINLTAGDVTIDENNKNVVTIDLSNYVEGNGTYLLTVPEGAIKLSNYGTVYTTKDLFLNYQLVANEANVVTFEIAAGEGVEGNAYELLTAFEYPDMEPIALSSNFTYEYEQMGGLMFATNNQTDYYYTLTASGEAEGAYDFTPYGVLDDELMVNQGMLTLMPGANGYTFTITVNKVVEEEPGVLYVAQPMNQAGQNVATDQQLQETEPGIYTGRVYLKTGAGAAFGFYTDIDGEITTYGRAFNVPVQWGTGGEFPGDWEPNESRVALTKGAKAGYYIASYPGDCEGYFDVRVDLNTLTWSMVADDTPVPPTDIYLWGTLGGYEYGYPTVNMGHFEKVAGTNTFKLEGFEVPACGIFTPDGEYKPGDNDPVEDGFYFFLNNSETQKSGNTVKTFLAPAEDNVIDIIGNGSSQTINGVVRGVVGGVNFIATTPGIYNFTFDWDTNTFEAELVTEYQEVIIEFAGVPSAYRFVDVVNVDDPENTFNYKRVQNLFSYNNLGVLNFVAKDGYTITVTAPENAPEGSYQIEGTVADDVKATVLGVFAAANGLTFKVTVSEQQNLFFENFVMNLDPKSDEDVTVNVDVDLQSNNVTPYKGFQFDIVVPEGLTVGEPVLNSAFTGEVAIAPQKAEKAGTNQYMVLAYLSTEDGYTETDALVTLPVTTNYSEIEAGTLQAGPYEVEILNSVIFSTIDGQEITSIEGWLGEVQINVADIPAESVEIVSVVLDEPSEPAGEEITEDSEITVGESLTVTVEVLPEDATNVDYEWTVEPDCGVTVKANEDGTWTVDTSEANVSEPTVVTVTVTVGEDENGDLIQDSFSFTLKPVLLGDSNDNGRVNVADVVTTANYIVELPVDRFCWPNANVILNDAEAEGARNGISVADVTATVEIAMNVWDENRNPQNVRRYTSRSMSNDRLVADNFKARQNKAFNVGVNLDNTVAYSAISATVNVPEGMTVHEVTVGPRAAGHELVYNITEDGRVNVVLYSVTNAAFGETEGSLFNLVVTAKEDCGNMTIGRISASDASSNIYDLNYEGGLNESVATGVDGLDADEAGDVRYYDINGVEVVNPEAGQILIRVANGNAEKVVIK